MFKLAAWIDERRMVPGVVPVSIAMGQKPGDDFLGYPDLPAVSGSWCVLVTVMIDVLQLCVALAGIGAAPESLPEVVVAIAALQTAKDVMCDMLQAPMRLLRLAFWAMALAAGLTIWAVLRHLPADGPRVVFVWLAPVGVFVCYVVFALRSARRLSAESRAGERDVLMMAIFGFLLLVAVLNRLVRGFAGGRWAGWRSPPPAA